MLIADVYSNDNDDDGNDDADKVLLVVKDLARLANLSFCVYRLYTNAPKGILVLRLAR